jgi:hypothetical protein
MFVVSQMVFDQKAWHRVYDIITLSFAGRRDTQHNDIQHNDILHNDTKHNDAQHNNK